MVCEQFGVFSRLFDNINKLFILKGSISRLGVQMGIRSSAIAEGGFWLEVPFFVASRGIAFYCMVLSFLLLQLYCTFNTIIALC